MAEKIGWLVAIALSIAVSASHAGEPGTPDLPTSLEWVVSSHEENYDFRVVVLTGGIEHTSSDVYFQWLVPDRESETGSRLVSSRVVKEISGGFHSVGQPLIEKAAGQFRVVLPATSTYEPTRTGTFTFLTQKPGEYRLEKKSGL